MPSTAVKSSELDSTHLGSFVALLSASSGERTIAIGRLVGVEHYFDNRKPTQLLAIALADDETVSFTTSDTGIEVADNACELLAALADRACTE